MYFSNLDNQTSASSWDAPWNTGGANEFSWLLLIACAAGAPFAEIVTGGGAGADVPGTCASVMVVDVVGTELVVAGWLRVAVNVCEVSEMWPLLMSRLAPLLW